MLPVSSASSPARSPNRGELTAQSSSPRRAPAMNATNSSEALLSSSPIDSAGEPTFSYNTTAPEGQSPAQLTASDHARTSDRPPAIVTSGHQLGSPIHAERIALTYSQQVPASAHPNLEPSSWNSSADHLPHTPHHPHADKASSSTSRRAGSLFRRPTLGGWSNSGPSPRLSDAPLTAPAQSPVSATPSGAKGWGNLRAAMRAKNKFIHRHHHHHAADETSVHRVPGAAPGIDIESESIDKYFSERLAGQVNGLVVDFNADQYQIRQGLANAELCEWISKPRPEYSAVRWIHVEGMAWDVIKTVSQIHGLHPLSIEDALHLPQRVKVDNFSNHLFISLLVCRLASLTSDISEIDVDARHRLLKQRLHPMAESGECTLLDIEADNCSMFLLDDGTLITFTHYASGFLVEPILSRLGNATTMLRSLSDASFLLNALIDSIVDHYLPITEAYADQFERLEAIVFEKPNIHIIRYLHATHADLIELKQKLLPVQTLIRNLRTMSHRVASSPTKSVPGTLQRPASVVGASSMTVLPEGTSTGVVGRKDALAGSNETKVAQERLSPICKTYLSDVQDHIDTCLDHVTTLQGWAQNLTDLAFNCISYTTNENMKVLTIASVVFLPITFLAGVYGTNFQYLPELAWEVGYPLFWSACILLVTVTLVYLKKRGFY